MSTSSLGDYIKGKLTPEVILEAKRRGFIEIEFDPITEDTIADDYDQSVKEMDEELKQLTGGVDVDINFLGFDSHFKKLNQLGSQDVGKIIKVRGFVNSSGIIKPMFDEAQYICRKCGHRTPMPQTDPFKLIPPTECDQPMGRNKCNGIKFDLDLVNSRYRDSRKISIQETPEDVSGQIPAWKYVFILKKSLLNRVKVGDLVNIIGMVKVRVKTGEESRFGDTYIEANNIIVKRKELAVSELSSDELAKITELSKQPNLYKELVFNIAPSLYGMYLEKEAALLALVGGVNKDLGDISRRDCIHLLLVGDPSVGKSQLLKAVSNLAPSGIYSSGKGTTTAGLTAAVIKEEKGGDWLVYAGVMVLADKGIACIDEIDKMNPDDRVAMHEAMEQQTVTVNKANIHVTLSARTTVISAANPILGRYDTNKTIADNIKNLPPTLLSRFDIIFVMIDRSEKEKDEALTDHILNDTEKYQRIDRALLKNYIIYAKQFNPVLTVEAKATIRAFYLESRKRQSPTDPIPITARQLESLIRLSQAHAKILLKDKVEPEDADAAIKLLSTSLSQTCKFGSVGADIDTLEHPKTASDKKEMMLRILDKGSLPQSEWEIACNEKGIIHEEFIRMLIKLSNEGTIYKFQDSPPIWAKAGRL